MEDIRSSFAGLAEWATGIVESLGYLRVSELAMFERAPPIQLEVILPPAGVLASQDRFSKA